jgi:Asp/Glu/hydantoin racemase
MYNDIALLGKCGTPVEVAFLERVARDLIDRGGAQAILLGGTDLSSFYADLLRRNILDIIPVIGEFPIVSRR